jgi:hypothetical protein
MQVIGSKGTNGHVKPANKFIRIIFISKLILHWKWIDDFLCLCVAIPILQILLGSRLNSKLPESFSLGTGELKTTKALSFYISFTETWHSLTFVV